MNCNYCKRAGNKYQEDGEIELNELSVISEREVLFEMADGYNDVRDIIEDILANQSDEYDDSPFTYAFADQKLDV